MWFKFVLSNNNFHNTGHVAYGIKPQDTTNERWIRAEHIGEASIILGKDR